MLLSNSNAIEDSRYIINRSLRFIGTAGSYLSRTPNGAGTSTTKLTVSFWMKLGSISAAKDLFVAGTATTNQMTIGVNASNQIFTYQNTASTTNISLTSTYVMRDPAAWYHVVFAYDTTDATAANRVKLYINGEQITLTQTTQPSLNLALKFNSAVIHSIGRNTFNSTQFDGYLAEVNMIDGLALTPQSFGTISPLTNEWVAKKYIGDYGINGFYLSFNDANTNSQNKLTYSEDATNAVWAKTNTTITSNAVAAPDGSTTADKMVETTANNVHHMFQTETISNVTQTVSVYAKVANVERPHIWLQASNGVTQSFTIFFDISTGTYLKKADNNIDYSYVSHFIYPVGNGWYRVGFTYTKGTQNTNDYFVIGLTDGSVDMNTSYTGNAAFGIYVWGMQKQLGTVVGPYYQTTSAAFAQTNNLGANFKTGSYGINNFPLTNFTRAAGISDCWMRDVPAGNSSPSDVLPSSNYCVLNQIDLSTTSASSTLSSANLRGTTNAGIGTGYSATMAVNFGKFYWEATMVSGVTAAASAVTIGIANAGPDTVQTSTQWFSSSEAPTFTNGDVIGMAYDGSGATGTLYFYKNNVLAKTITGIDQTAVHWLPVIRDNLTTSVVTEFNFGQRDFTYTPPAGYRALCSVNLPASTVTNPKQHFDVVPYTGTGASLDVTHGLGRFPDFYWLKSRNAAQTNGIYDVIRGVSNVLFTNTAGIEEVVSGVTAATATNFTLGTDAKFNTLNNTYISWLFKAGGFAVSNTDGTIASQVSANQTAKFSIVSYTGTGVAGDTVGHGLGVAPELIIIKARNLATQSWRVFYTVVDGSMDFMLMESTAAFANSSVNVPTSSVFTLGSSTDHNNATTNYIAYCFAEVFGFSKISKYVGNGNADGSFVYCGFSPRFILIKRADTTANWTIFDSERLGYNPDSNPLYPNLTNAEATTDLIDITSNGFKIRSTDASLNATSGTYLYMAFAENPFNNNNAQ